MREWLLIALVVATANAAPPAPEPAPALPDASVKLTVSPKAGAGAASGSWQLRIENTGETPIRIPAEARLLVLELTPPAAAPDPKAKNKVLAPPKCVLPDDARPSNDEGRDLVLPPHRSWSASFDPLFYCFGAKERGALVAGTQVRARFGWPEAPPKANAKPKPRTAPFAATPVGASMGKVAAMKSIDADPFTLDAAVLPAPAPLPDEGAYLTVPEALDSARGVELGTTVTLTNKTDRAMTMMFRSDMVVFRVQGPTGPVSCGGQRRNASPIRELMSTVGVKGKSEVGVLFSATCSGSTFDEAGIYRVVPVLDTTGASGRSIGIKTWDGVATAPNPLLVRIRNPRSVALPPRPVLD